MIQAHITRNGTLEFENFKQCDRAETRLNELVADSSVTRVKILVMAGIIGKRELALTVAVLWDRKIGTLHNVLG